MILIVGLMFGSFTSAIVGILTYFSTAEELRKFTFWSMGNLGNLSWSSILILTVCVVAGFVECFSIKPLNALLLGKLRRSLGMNFKKTRLIIIFATSILAGSISICRTNCLYWTSLRILQNYYFKPATMRYCSEYVAFRASMLICDVISELPGLNITLPINAVTSIIGAQL
jgi:iron complex transport system permease protein